MAFTFTIEKSGDMEKTIENLKERAAKMGATISGDKISGTIKSAEGIEGTYTTTPDHIEITITKSPYPEMYNDMIIGEVKNQFRLSGSQ